jgi:hypothetical protein
MPKLLLPMLDEAAAPDIAIAEAMSMLYSLSRNFSDRRNPVAVLPNVFGEKKKNSAFRPRLAGSVNIARFWISLNSSSSSYRFEITRAFSEQFISR